MNNQNLKTLRQTLINECQNEWQKNGGSKLYWETKAKLQLLDEVRKIINDGINEFGIDHMDEDYIPLELRNKLKQSILGISDNEEGAKA